MPDIRYVCLSDLHLGADNSILTSIRPDSIEVDPLRPDPVLCHLVACLHHLIKQNESSQKPMLVLNGDILELALSDTNTAAMVFERFIDLVFPEDGDDLFDKHILYLPGNHDHHIWESARETQYVHFISTLELRATLEAPWHITKMVRPKLIKEYFLTSLLRRHPHLRDAIVQVVYPNYALFDENGQKCIIFSHGHYIEAIYSLMSTLNTMMFPDRKKPTTMQDLEAENFAWVDFFWSTMGRSGDVGQDIGLLYDKMQDKQQFEQLLDHFVTNLAEQGNLPHWLQGTEVTGLKLLVKLILSRLSLFASKRLEQPLSPDAIQGLKSFIEGPLRKQLLTEHQQVIPGDSTFIFGHTHKPFQQSMEFEGYPAPINVYNSGGWVVDKLDPHPIYGAACILIDEALHPITLRMYNQAANDEAYRVDVAESLRSGEMHSSFYTRICTLVQPDQDPWKSFSRSVAEAVRIHTHVLQTKINL